MSSLERRFADVRVEVRLRPDDADKRTIGGYAAMFDKRSDDLGGFYEVIDRRAFNGSRGRSFPGVVARYNHDDNMLLGTTSARTLRLDVDDTGLLYDVDLPTHRSDVYELVQRGDVARSSFAFRVLPDGDTWEMDDNDMVRRTLTNVQLYDVAPVNTPAYQDTSVGVRNLDVAVRSLARQVEADPSEVRDAYEARELRRFFKRTDQGGKAPMNGAAAVAFLLGNR